MYPIHAAEMLDLAGQWATTANMEATSMLGHHPAGSDDHSDLSKIAELTKKIMDVFRCTRRDDIVSGIVAVLGAHRPPRPTQRTHHQRTARQPPGPMEAGGSTWQQTACPVDMRPQDQVPYHVPASPSEYLLDSPDTHEFRLHDEVDEVDELVPPSQPRTTQETLPPVPTWDTQETSALHDEDPSLGVQRAPRAGAGLAPARYSPSLIRKRSRR